jgi:hypothetical protein
MDVQDLIAERAKTNGDFRVHARVTQKLKSIVQAEMKWESLTDSQKESLHMIMHKIGRIIAGNAAFKDHWDDIAGYAKLVADQCPT